MSGGIQKNKTSKTNSHDIVMVAFSIDLIFFSMVYPKKMKGFIDLPAPEARTLKINACTNPEIPPACGKTDLFFRSEIKDLCQLNDSLTSIILPG